MRPETRGAIITEMSGLSCDERCQWSDDEYSVISVTPINLIATVTVFVSDNVSIFGNLSVLSLLSTS